MQDNPVQRYVALCLLQLQILHLSLSGPGEQTGGGGEDVVGGDGGACTEQAGARHNPHHPGVPGAPGLLYPPGTEARFKEINSLKMD